MNLYIGDSLSYHRGMRLSTSETDQDASSTQNCAEKYHSGFWYNSFLYTNPNGLYGSEGAYGGQYLHWSGFRGGNALKAMEMKFRPNY